MKKLIFILLTLCLISPVMGVINITPIEIGDNYITWSWDSNLSINNMSMDGYQIKYFDQSATTFTLSDLRPMEQHTFRLYTSTDSGMNTTNTTSSGTTAQDSFWKTVGTYILFIIGMLCVIVAVKYEQFFAFAGLIIGAVVCLLASTIFVLILGIILAFASVFVAFKD